MLTGKVYCANCGKELTEIEIMNMQPMQITLPFGTEHDSENFTFSFCHTCLDHFADTYCSIPN